MTTGNKTWIDTIDARLVGGTAAELLSAATDDPVAVDRAAWAELWPFDGPCGAVTRADVAAVARNRD